MKSTPAKRDLIAPFVKAVSYTHLYNFKLKHAIGFLQDGDKVKAYVFFKGRSILFKEQGEVLLLSLIHILKPDISV